AADAPAANKDDEYNFNWLDPDKKIYVLQNRKYTKALRFMPSIMGGFGFSNPIESSYNLEGRGAFFINEQFGFEGFYQGTFNTTNALIGQINTAAPSLHPVVRTINGRTGGLFMWVPWYSKINIFNAILYFDWYFAGGAGAMFSTVTNGAAGDGSVVTQTNFAGYFETGNLFHVSNHWIIRWNFSGTIFGAPLGGNTGPMTVYTDYNFGLGVGFAI
ncbi:MAG: hypothetical protein ACXVBW_05490, partial [Bdellovibrionota bacterium]